MDLFYQQPDKPKASPVLPEPPQWTVIPGEPAPEIRRARAEQKQNPPTPTGASNERIVENPQFGRMKQQCFGGIPAGFSYIPGQTAGEYADSFSLAHHADNRVWKTEVRVVCTDCGPVVVVEPKGSPGRAQEICESPRSI